MHPILAAREKQGDTYYKDPALGSVSNCSTDQ